MAQAHFVKKARKDNSAVKKGESYYWWAHMVGGRGGPKHYSAEKPTRSQLTQSAFKSTLYAIQDGANAQTPDCEELEDARDGLKDELDGLKDETEGSLENMPDGLKEGDSGQTLQTRIDSLESAIDELDGVDCSFEPDETSEDSEDDQKTAFAEEKWSEITGIVDGIDEG